MMLGMCESLIANGQASDPDGLNLNKQVFPVVMAGWRTSK